jgi:hypothetical protein
VCDLRAQLKGTLNLTPFHIFIIRAIIGAVVAVVISRAFFGEIQIIYVAGLAVILIGLAYFAEYLRQRRK